ncbi:dihydrodipicolinate synthase [Sulfobacillus acidophilus TPY]|uniref:4-hydroxy-tetrahydrodipicolinate synthase n=1 Tax=Sulfobacillus acidophilus (strain ATCC 700253 / DSM 10332 / NAL) TaxID=679936 RepID=G8TVN0_SULAD|nr:dihydrodipicolinate synthase [Sulfobacillus acidophilus TPY]AEW03669.1 dihydrodipicolinate synthase [Sulfobacillus acidophilus DSM 10332]
MQWPRLITAMVTPFTENGELDEERAESLAHWLIEQGSEGLVVAGTTGESPTLTPDERERLFRAVRRGAPTATVLMGTGTNNTEHAREMSHQAAEWGADGVLLVTPYYNKPPQDGLFHHFVRITRDLPIPAMLYNVPGRTGVNLEARTVRRIIDASPNVIAIKEAGGTIQGFEQLREHCPDLTIYSGDDALFYPSLGLGTYGVVSVAAHVVGPEMARMIGAFVGGQGAEAQRLHLMLAPLFRDLFSWPNPIPVKWLLNHIGVPVGPVRLPLVFPEDQTALNRLADEFESIRASRSSAAFLS